MMNDYDSPLWKLCKRAEELHAVSDWQAITIDPLAGTVELTEAIADEFAYLLNPGTPHQTISYSRDAGAYVYREVAMHDSEYVSAHLLYGGLFDYGDILEPVTFQPTMLDVLECEECSNYDEENGEWCEEDHSAGWAFIYRRAV